MNGPKRFKRMKQGIETRFSIWSNYVLTKKKKNTQFLDELNRSNLIILTRWIIDKFQMIWILINEPFDEIYLLQSYLDGIFVLWTTWSIGNPQLKYKNINGVIILLNTPNNSWTFIYILLTIHNTQHMSQLHLQKKIWKGLFSWNILSLCICTIVDVFLSYIVTILVKVVG